MGEDVQPAQPLVSVLITSYNREDYLGAAIESALKQSLENIEVIVGDNASSDASAAIAHQWAAKDSRVRVFAHSENLGQFPNRNFVAQQARGKYLKYLDSDDLLYPHALEMMVALMEGAPTPTGAVEKGMLLAVLNKQDAGYPLVLTPQETYTRCFVQLQQMSITPMNTLFTRAAFMQAGGFNEAGTYGLSADFDLLMRIARTTRTVLAPLVMAYYRVHAGQDTELQTGGRYPNFHSGSVHIALDVLRHEGCPLPEKLRRSALASKVRLALRYTLSLALRHRQWARARTFLKAVRLRFSDIALACWPLHSLKKYTNNVSVEDVFVPNFNAFPRAYAPAPLKTELAPPEVSVLLPVTETVTLLKLRATLESLRAQTLGAWEGLLMCVEGNAAHVQLQTMLVDLKNEGVADARVQIIAVNAEGINKHKQSKAQGCLQRALINTGVARAQGKAVRFFEAGAWLYPFALEWGVHLLNVAEKQGSSVVLEGSAGWLPLPTLLNAAQAKERALKHNLLKTGASKGALFNAGALRTLQQTQGGCVFALPGLKGEALPFKWACYALCYQLLSQGGCGVNFKTSPAVHSNILDARSSAEAVPPVLKTYLAEQRATLPEPAEAFVHPTIPAAALNYALYAWQK